MTSTAAILLSCGLPTFEMSLRSAIKYLPEDLPLYIIDDTKANTEERRYLNVCLDSVDGTIERIYLDDRRYDHATGIFAKLFPKYDLILKFDDDVFFTDKDVFPGLVAAYNQADNPAMSCAFQPIQRLSLPMIAKRLDIVLPDDLLYTDLRHTLGQWPALAETIWDMTCPPEPILKKLRERQPRFISIDGSRMRHMHWTICHMLIASKDAAGIMDEEYKRGEEHYIHQIKVKQRRPIAIDTHNLVYHYAWTNGKEYSDKHILPKLRKMKFWQT